MLDSTGKVVVEYIYDAWGNHAVVDANGYDIVNTAHIGILNPFRYRGYYYDTETELYYLQTRYYDPELCRFMTIDGIEYAESKPLHGLNLYAYCANNPVMNVDPTGNSFSLIAFIIIGAVIGALAIAGGVYNAVNASQQGASSGEIAHAFFSGFLAIVTVAGAIIFLSGTVIAIAGVTGALAAAAIGAVVMMLGYELLGAISGIEVPEFESFPEPPEFLPMPPPITGF